MSHGPYAQATFEDQFEELSGTAVSEAYSWEVPYDLILTRASVGTKSATAAAEDAYIVIEKAGSPDIVPAGPGGSRTLPVKTDTINGVDLAEIPCKKGDVITVNLFLVTNNVVNRATVILGYCCLTQKLGILP